MATALYGPDGFFVRPGPGPAAHFRTSVNASPRFAEALLALLERLDRALRHPDRLTVVDVGAGRGELLTRLATAAPAELSERLELVAVEVVPPPSESLAESRSGRVAGPVWSRTIPSGITGLLIGSEWLDNVPVEVAELDPDRVARYVLVDLETGAESLGEPVTGADAAWLETWWPLREPGARAEIGLPRDRAWAEAVTCLAQGAALAIDYGHRLADRPPLGTLTGYRDGRQVTPVPDGSCDLTAHVAIDAVSHAGPFALHTNTHAEVDQHRAGGVLVRQAAALRALGVTGARPPLELASTDPAGYLHRLSRAGAAAELTDPAGLGGHYWLFQPVGLEVDVARWLT